MSHDGSETLSWVVANDQAAILERWLVLLKEGVPAQSGRIREAELQTQARNVLALLGQSLASNDRRRVAEDAALREALGAISEARALQGFTPTETANFVLTLKLPVFEAINKARAGDGNAIADAVAVASQVLDHLGLYTMEVFQKNREDVIRRQSQEIAELSTPVVQLWNGILALPLIGTLDSARTGVVMENLLQAIVDVEAEIAIIDITGVPTVDTLVAQHLLKTIAAARLMGADCIISGIRPQIAQTMVHLGVELNVVSKATLADALAVALKRTGRTVVRLDSIGHNRSPVSGRV